ncbi:hypothetical protein TNCV_4790391 [Trichonephila clavipes]|nr:hypothetical protein TNCV_4790391 [Trichonephila clavipes]
MVKRLHKGGLSTRRPERYMPLNVVSGIILISNSDNIRNTSEMLLHAVHDFFFNYGCPRFLGQILWEFKEHHRDSDLHSNPWPKRLHSGLGGVGHKSIVRNIPALPRSFELLYHAEEYETFYEHRIGRYAQWLMDWQKKIVSRKVPIDGCIEPPNIY